MHLHVLALGTNATPGQVLQRTCSDLPHSTFPSETTAYELAKAINGWYFGVDPSQEMVDGACNS